MPHRTARFRPACRPAFRGPSHFCPARRKGKESATEPHSEFSVRPPARTSGPTNGRRYGGPVWECFDPIGPIDSACLPKRIPGRLLDSGSTEAKTFDAVETAFAEIDLIIKKVANINGSNMLLTADHGFLFQQDDLDPGDMAAVPAANEWSYRSRRFVLGKGIESSPKVTVFTSTALGVGGEWQAAFPRSLGRFPVPGSGKRFVHGGTSLQEVVVPVVKIHKARSEEH